MKLTVLMENTACDGFACEHGLSLLIQWRGHTLLLDTGSSDLFLQNADALGVDLGQVEVAALSHSHYDHSGGFEGFFRRNAQAPVYLQRLAEERCFRQKQDGSFRYIGLPEGLLDAHPDRFRWVEGEAQLWDGAWLLPHTLPNLTEKGKMARMYRERRNGQMGPDDFRHEQSLVLETEAGLVLFNSCSHAGADDIVEEVAARFPDKPLAAFVGGFHLMVSGHPEWMAVPEPRVRQMGQRLRAAGVQVYTGHCTGAAAYRVLQEELGEHLHPLHAGSVMTLPD